MTTDEAVCRACMQVPAIVLGTMKHALLCAECWSKATFHMVIAGSDEEQKLLRKTGDN